MKVALVTDWITGGGAERVVEAVHELYPKAPVYTSYISKRQKPKFKQADVRTLWTSKIPLSGKLKKFLPLLRERAFAGLDLSQYDLVISLSGAEAKGIKAPKKTLHISYIHAPTHYYWVRYDEYLKNPGFGIFDPIARLGLKTLIQGRRKWDYQAAQRPNLLVANSTITKNRIKEYYNRDSIVVFPPVDIDRFQLNKDKKRIGFVTAGRQTPYKKTEIIVEACSKLNLPLKVIGDGPDHQRLKKIAGANVEFLNKVSDQEMVGYFQSAEAFIFASLDDFGITPVEAMATGTPIIAFGEGGALDTVADGKSGLFFHPQTTEALELALGNFKNKKFNPDSVRSQAEKFSANKFKRTFKNLVDTEFSKFKNH